MSYLYFVQCQGDDGPIKVGLAHNVGRRIENLQIGCPYALALIAKVWCGDQAEALERKFHEVHREHRMRGEWYTAAILPIALEMARVTRDIVVKAIETGELPPPVIAFDEHGAIIPARPRRNPTGRPKGRRGFSPGEFVWRGRRRRSLLG